MMMMMMMIMIMINEAFVVWLTNERRLALFSAWTIAARDFHNRESPTRRAGFELVQNLSSGFVEWSCAVVIPTSRHYYYHNCHYYRVALSYVTSYGLTLHLMILYSPI